MKWYVSTYDSDEYVNDKQMMKNKIIDNYKIHTMDPFDNPNRLIFKAYGISEEIVRKNVDIEVIYHKNLKFFDEICRLISFPSKLYNKPEMELLTSIKQTKKYLPKIISFIQDLDYIYRLNEIIIVFKTIHRIIKDEIIQK